MPAEQEPTDKYSRRLVALRVRVALGIVAAVFVAALSAYLFRVPLIAAVTAPLVSLLTGYQVHYKSLAVGHGVIAATDVTVARGSEPILTAPRIDASYALRDIFPGGSHRFGFLSIDVEQPHVTLVHHADGSYNLPFAPASSGSPSAPGRAAGAPLFFTARVRGGTLDVIDRTRVDPAARDLHVAGIDLDASVKTDQRTHYVLHASYAAGGRSYPVAAIGTIDLPHEFASHHLTAALLPLRGPFNYISNSPSLRLDDGYARNVDVRYFAVHLRADAPAAYHLAGTAGLDGVQLNVPALVLPVTGLGGAIRLYDGGVTAAALRARIAGVPLRAAGGVFDFAHLTLRLGIVGDGDLDALRHVFAFSATHAMRGPLHLAGLIESDAAQPLIVVDFRGSHARYEAYPIDALGGTAAYYDSGLTLAAVHGVYAALAVRAGGELTFAQHLASQGYVGVDAPARTLPYLTQTLPRAVARIDAAVSGVDLTFDAGGTLIATGGGRAAGLFSIDRRGRGAFGPLAIERADGGSLVAGFILDRPTSRSSVWASAHHFGLGHEASPVLPGVTLPVIPVYDGSIDGELAGEGTPSAFYVAGDMRTSGARLGGFAVDRGRLAFAGRLDALHIGSVTASGPWGSVDQGSGGLLRDGSLALAGRFHGTFTGLQPYTGDLGAVGTIDGPVTVLQAGPRLVVQTTGASLAGSHVHGVPVERVAGTLTVADGRVAALAAQATVGGRTVTALGPGSGFTVSAQGLPAGALREGGLPLDAGTVNVVGRTSLSGLPRFDGATTFSNGRFLKYEPVWGSADLTWTPNRLGVGRAALAVGRNVARLNGQIGLAGNSPHYALAAAIAEGDLADLVHTLHLPVKYLYGSFGGTLAVGGAGAMPSLTGPVELFEGAYNGLGFRDGRSQFYVDPVLMRAYQGTVAVGSTQLGFGVRLSSNDIGVSVHTPHTNLADFNDYFDAGDTLDGSGRVQAEFRSSPGSVSTHGDIQITGLRYRRVRFGDTDAAWSNAGRTVRSTLSIGDRDGRLNLGGHVILGSGVPAVALRGATYDLTALLVGLRLQRWVPEMFDLFSANEPPPILGLVDGNAHITGRYPRLGIDATAAVHDGAFGKIPIQQLSVTARASGGRTQITQATLDLGFFSASATGSFSLAPNDPLDFHISGRSDQLAAMLQRTTGAVFDVGGTLTTDATVTGPARAPTLDAGFDVEGGHVLGMTIPRLAGSIAVTGRAFQLRDAELLLPHGAVYVAGSLPLELDPFRLGPRNAPVAFSVESRAVQLADFAPLLPQGTQLAGTLDGRFGVGGTLRNPNLLGAIDLTNGSFESPLERAKIAGATARLSFSGTSATLDELHAQVGGGTIDGHGSVAFPNPRSTAPVTYAFEATAKGAQYDLPAYGRGTLDGTVTLTSGSVRPTLGGAITLSDASIPFSAIYHPSSSATSAPPPFDVGLGLVFNAGKNVRVQSRPTIDLGADGSLAITGTLAAPQLNGTFTSTGGTLTYFNRVFRVDHGTVTFEPGGGFDPYLDAVATTRVANPDPDPVRNPSGFANIQVRVTGPVSNINIALSSDPAYGRTQILGLLLNATALGAVNFDTAGGTTTTLRGVPSQQLAGLPPGLFGPQSNTGTVNLSQEAFSIVNAQFLSGLLSPIETGLGSAFGLSDVALTVDYGGGVGVNVRKAFGKNIYFIFGQTFSYPQRQTYGVAARPNPTTSLQLTFFTQPANTFESALTHYYGNYQIFDGQPLYGTSGFSFSFQKLFW